MSDFSWGELHKRAQPIKKHARTKKHAEHDQQSHGSWAGGRGGGRVTASGAYGRDYKSKKAVLADWNAYKDFTMRGMRGGYINRQDADRDGIEMNIRYDNDRKVVVIPPQKPQSPAERQAAMNAGKPISKHAEHDQKSHGSWANGRGGGSGGSTYVSDQEKKYKETKFSNSPAGYKKMEDMRAQFSRALNADGIFQRGERESIQRTIDDLDSRMAPKWSRSDMKSIVDNRQAKTIDGVLVDMQTANLLFQITDGANRVTRDWLESLPVEEAATRAWRTQG